MKRLNAAVAALALVAGITSCTWSSKENIDTVTWSDDGQGQAFLRMRWEERKVYQILETITERRGYEHQLYVQSSDGSGRRSLTDFSTGRPSPELYYMKSQGYLIYGAVPQGAVMTLWRIDLQGNQRSIISSDAAYSPCGALSAVPSPDGSQLAVLERKLNPGSYAPPSPPPPDDHAQCQDVVTTVKLLDAASLALQGQWTWTADGFTEYGWMSDGAFYVQAVSTSWRIDPQSGPVPVSQPACLFPKTTSSRVSAAGVSITPGPDSDDPVFTTGSGGSPFGTCG
ncbi:MAG: hypothetical protein JRI68_25570 [Deltaproteobacteria bacterium]|nr:hypothetical protein [Deltaproteobacteria bacterium]